MNIKLWYSVRNGGDGSAYPVFFATKEEAEEHQRLENENEGWGEDCFGDVDITLQDNGNYTIPQKSLGWSNEPPYEEIFFKGKDKHIEAILETG